MSSLEILCGGSFLGEKGVNIGIEERCCRREEKLRPENRH